jgi:nucleoside-diphosphate-sugar epimerase
MAHILITGGAGYIGSMLTGVLLNRGHQVTVLDDLLFGGESLLSYFTQEHFRFHKVNVCTPATREYVQGIQVVFHLAAIVGFPACHQIGEVAAFQNNVEATKYLFDACEHAGVQRFIFASTYSNYGLSANGQPVTEDSPLRPQSLYARTKIAAEEYLLTKGCTSGCAPIIPRFATLFGLSPRMRFDLILNQFVLEALTQKQLILYQGDYRRSFVHVRDVVEALCLLMEAPEEAVRCQVFNVGSNVGNYFKQEIIELIKKHIPSVEIECRNMAFDGDMRDISVCFNKIERTLQYKAQISVEQGILEVMEALTSGLIKDPFASKYRNHEFIIN